LGGCYGVLSKRRADFLNDDIREGTHI
jgi:hypothetical protein